jgi:osmotically-inducible protein OsmY
LESMSGENPFDGVTAGANPIAGSAHPPAQFQLGADNNQTGQGRSDEQIKLAVMTALHWDLAVPRDRVQVRVDHGRVTLTGQVARDYEKARAEADALMVPGVAGVTNSIAFFDEVRDGSS